MRPPADDEALHRRACTRPYYSDATLIKKYQQVDQKTVIASPGLKKRSYRPDIRITGQVPGSLILSIYQNIYENVDTGVAKCLDPRL
jgi:hypothetical protein